MAFHQLLRKGRSIPRRLRWLLLACGVIGWMCWRNALLMHEQLRPQDDYDVTPTVLQKNNKESSFVQKFTQQDRRTQQQNNTAALLKEKDSPQRSTPISALNDVLSTPYLLTPTRDKSDSSSYHNEEELPLPSEKEHLELRLWKTEKNDNQFVVLDKRKGETNHGIDIRCQSKCLHKFGKNGTWVQDWNFSSHYGQYPTPWLFPPGPFIERTHGAFQPSTHASFPWPTSWRWQDYGSGCPVDYTIMSGEKICAVLQNQTIDRILFHGDSLTESMFQALVNKLGSMYIENITKHSLGYEASLICKTQGTVIQILQLRGGGGQVLPDSPRTNFTFDIKTRGFLQSSPTPVLGIFNIGAHYHTMEDYKEDMDILLGLLKGLERQQDLYIFRTTCPGHKGCGPGNPIRFNWKRGTRDKPLRTYQDYIVTKKYDWNLFEHYNQHTLKLLQQRHDQLPVVHFLDIFNMTVLRRDGHLGVRDCLHYVLPGAVDWWNHLLFTYLQELANTSKNGCRPVLV